MARVRIHNFSVSLDGFATGEGQALETPFGHAGHRLHDWMFATKFGHREILRQSGGSEGIDHAMADRHGQGIGAEIMGAGKFGPPGWQDDPSWRGWWGDNPPFHTPTYVLTHRPRPSLPMEGGTTFHFLNAGGAEALAVAREAAAGRDVRIGGGPTMVREFLGAGLVDHLHVVVVPILLGRGVRLWEGTEALEQRYQVEVVTSPSGVTHLTFTR
jgi:dihydrofolate reductase